MTTQLTFNSKLTVEYNEFGNTEQVFKHWQALQSHRASIFLSLSWIRPWLLTIKNGTIIYSITFTDQNNNTIVGMAFLASTRLRRRKIFSIDVLSLNESEKSGDKFIIEYNNILHNPAYQEDVYYSFFDFFANSAVKFDEIKLNAIDACNTPNIKELCEKFNLNFIEEELSKAYFTDLTEFQSNPELYISVLSRNKREQIRRSIKYYNNYGSEEIRLASSPHEAIEFFDQLGVLHQNYWISKGHSGSFSNHKWIKFHKNIIKNYFANVQLIRVSYGEHIVGYLYNFIDHNIAYSLQSGFNYSDNKNDRPGIISHFLLTQQYIKDSLKRYEFLAGESQYKQSLSTNYNNLGWYSIQRKSMKMLIENRILWLARLFKRLLSQI